MRLSSSGAGSNKSRERSGSQLFAQGKKRAGQTTRRVLWQASKPLKKELTIRNGAPPPGRTPHDPFDAHARVRPRQVERERRRQRARESRRFNCASPPPPKKRSAFRPTRKFRSVDEGVYSCFIGMGSRTGKDPASSSLFHPLRRFSPDRLRHRARRSVPCLRYRSEVMCEQRNSSVRSDVPALRRLMMASAGSTRRARSSQIESEFAPVSQAWSIVNR